MTNITFGVALIIILIILPGGIFRRAYLSSEFSNYHLRTSNFSEIVFTIGMGVLMQCIGILFVKYLVSRYTIDFNIIGQLLTSPSQTTFKAIGDYITPIFFYNISLCIFGFILGRALMYFVLTRRLDEKVLMFKFDNEWNYIFTGKLFARKKNDEIFKYVNVCVAIDDSFVVYTGFLRDYWLNSTGQLEIIELTKVKRKVIDRKNVEGVEQNNPPHTEYKFEVDKLLIPYAQIKNLSITYYDLE